MRFVMGALVATMLVAALGQTIITPALPIIVSDLGGIEHISWAFTAYLLATTISAPVYGKLSDMFGRKLMLQTGILIFLAGSAAAALAWDLYSLVVFRFLQGIGGGGLIVTSMAAFADFLPPRERGKAQALVGAAFGISTVIGPLVGGIIVEMLDWRWLFLVNLPVGLLVFGIIAFAFESRRERQKRKIDFAGVGLLATTLASLVIYSSIGGTVIDWLSPQALAILAIALVSFAGFIVAERRAEEPILPLSLFRINGFVVSNMVGFIVGTVMFGTITFLPSYLLIVKGFTPTQAGLGLLPLMLGLITTSTLAGSFMSRTGRYKILPILAALLLTAGAALFSTIDADTPVLLVLAYTGLIGLGIGPSMSIGVSVIQNSVPREVLGVGTASANMFRQIGGSFGVAVLGALFANRLTYEVAAVTNGSTQAFDAQSLAQLSAPVLEQVREAYAMALHPVFYVCAGLGLLAFAVGWLLREVPLGEPDEAKGGIEATQAAK